MIAGDIYGVVLNDQQELAQLAGQFSDAPYKAPPNAPVVYMKPRSAIARGAVALASGASLVASATLALLFARSASRVSEEDAMDAVGAACLALDLRLPQPSYYRPAIAASNSDGFLVLGDFGAPVLSTDISMSINGEDAHHWTTDRLLRGPARLIAELSAFMTFRAGDLLLIGLPGDAPQVGPGDSLEIVAGGHRAIHSRIEEEKP